jgi:hypothetical protein
MTEEDFNYLPAGLAFLNPRKSWNLETASVFCAAAEFAFGADFSSVFFQNPFYN